MNVVEEDFWAYRKTLLAFISNVQCGMTSRSVISSETEKYEIKRFLKEGCWERWAGIWSLNVQYVNMWHSETEL